MHFGPTHTVSKQVVRTKRPRLSSIETLRTNDCGEYVENYVDIGRSGIQCRSSVMLTWLSRRASIRLGLSVTHVVSAHPRDRQVLTRRYAQPSKTSKQPQRQPSSRRRSTMHPRVQFLSAPKARRTWPQLTAILGQPAFGSFPRCSR